MTFDQLAIFSFGDGSLAYRRAAHRVSAQAAELNSSIHSLSFDKEDLTRAFPIESQLIDWGARGLGYWKWKPLALRLALTVLPDSVSHFAYVDSGCWVHKSDHSLNRLGEYLELSSSYGGVTFSSGQGNTEEKFSKIELLSHMSASRTEAITTQRAAGVWILNRQTASFIADEWWKICNTGDLIADSFDERIQSPAFIAHRNDQSVFSLLVKRLGIPMSHDVIDIHPAHSEIGHAQDSVPFWAARHRSGFKSLSMNPIIRAARFFEQKIP